MRAICGSVAVNQLRTSSNNPVGAIDFRASLRTFGVEGSIASAEKTGRRRSQDRRLSRTRDCVDVEVVWLDRQRLLELEVVRGVVEDEVEALQEVHYRDLDLLPGEWAALGNNELSSGYGLVVVRLTMQPRMP